MNTPAELLLKTQRFSVVRQTRVAPDGSTHVRDTVQHPGSVTILPLLDDNRVCLIENYRVAVDATLIELPAGTREVGEDPLETARRELSEETGYRAERIELLCEFFLSPGILNERMQLFAATGLTQGATALEAGEEIRPLVVTWREAMQMVDEGRVRDAKSIVGLLYYDRFRR